MSKHALLTHDRASPLLGDHTLDVLHEPGFDDSSIEGLKRDDIIQAEENSMSRIPLFPMDEMTAEQHRVYDAVASGPRGKVEGPIRAALHKPDLADKWQQLGAALRYGTSLPPRLSELAILLTARAWDSQFEWYAHEPHALRAGLSREAVDAIRTGKTPSFSNEDEQAVHDYVTELQRTRQVSEKTYQRALGLFDVVGVVELTALTGYYSMVAMTLNAHEIPLPEGTAPPLPVRT